MQKRIVIIIVDVVLSYRVSTCMYRLNGVLFT